MVHFSGLRMQLFRNQMIYTVCTSAIDQDMTFYMRQYHKALTCYDMCLDHLFSVNVATWKDVREVMARCYYMHLEEQEKATEIIHQLVCLTTRTCGHTHLALKCI
ncbi:hypothetical protein LSH36_51g03033 [Paralvinella palmiformis]|uniref:Uncharacterized protein n=1 Tax=Paralvinella palmiformis TaxID=53620 RepID=A0AAD9K5W7_9ANNE|nr:hypothetical protein LSH36_51g03033 [Paralvinella palmiformis]